MSKILNYICDHLRQIAIGSAVVAVVFFCMALWGCKHVNQPYVMPQATPVTIIAGTPAETVKVQAAISQRDAVIEALQIKVRDFEFKLQQAGPEAKKVELQETNKARAPLLWASVACGIAAIVFSIIKYPTPAVCCVVGGFYFIMQWQTAANPMLSYISYGFLIVGSLIFLGYETWERFFKKSPAPVPENPVIKP